MVEKVFRTRTEEEYLDLMNQLSNSGFTWQSGDDLRTFYQFHELTSSFYTKPDTYVFRVNVSKEYVLFGDDSDDAINWHIGDNVCDYLNPFEDSEEYTEDEEQKNIVPSYVYDDFKSLSANEIVDKVVNDDISDDTYIWLRNGHSDQFLKILDGEMQKTQKEYFIYNTLENTFYDGDNAFLQGACMAHKYTREEAEKVLEGAKFELVEVDKADKI